MIYAYLDNNKQLLCKLDGNREVATLVYQGNILRADLYAEYERWVAAGNEATIYIRPSIEERLQAAETLINLILDEG